MKYFILAITLITAFAVTFMLAGDLFFSGTMAALVLLFQISLLWIFTSSSEYRSSVPQ
ncbi:hypothetical protein CA267_008320 [Alteromonas pelagimontana]|uniref:Uncharacterized protein n=1 Tax=Alteromonas pelagimontana TaxID=1858656 RepID=A0A6M4MC66_9ALTE|nr:hypothetical protein [Alteromonas pelagimontana]QJR80781.1 hypothetical protein CA267_008320 [Alteromonas pelagimontana]